MPAQVNGGRGEYFPAAAAPLRDVADEKGTIGPEAAGELLESCGSEIQFEEPVHHFQRQGAVGRAAAEACTHRNALFDPNGHGSYAVFVPKQTPRLCREVIKRVVQFAKQTGEAQYDDEVIQKIEESVQEKVPASSLVLEFI